MPVLPMVVEIDEPRFLLDWAEPERETRIFRAGGLSILLHIAALCFLFLAPWARWTPKGEPQVAEFRRVTPLVAPPPELTQTAPNRGKISKEFNVESLLPRPPLYTPSTPPGAPPSARTPARPPSLPPSSPKPPVPMIEAPNVEVPKSAQQVTPAFGSPAAQLQAPEIQTEEKPKLAFERPGSMQAPPRPAPGGRIAPPSGSVDEAIRRSARGSAGGGVMVGDQDAGSGVEGLNLPASPGRTGSSLELLSDPGGVDFRPYLVRILATVRRNWLAVVPETARLGYRGRVQIQFAISRDGSVPKLVIATPSGLDALDRAAVAGISASNPFPPLPGEYRGNQIRLQFTFLYNMPR